MPKRIKPAQDRGLEAVALTNGQTGWRARAMHQGRPWRSRIVLSKTLARRLYQQQKLAWHEQDAFPTLAPRRQARRLTVSDLMALVLADYRRNRRKTLRDAEYLAAFWTQTAGTHRASDITGTWLLQQADRWLKAGCSPATVNRRMDKLLKGFRLACEADPPLLGRKPTWKRLKESAPRAGYLEWPVFTQIRAALTPAQRIPLTIAFWTGMRWGEITALRRSQQHFDHQQQTVRLDLAGHDTKTGQPRRAVFPGDLYDTLWAWEQSTQAQHPACPWISHLHGQPIGTIDTAWKTVCVRLGLATGDLIRSVGAGRRPGRTYYWRAYRGPLIHDLRRVGVRNMESAGVPRQVGKAISGHKTDSTYDRYNIVSEKTLAEAGAKVVAYVLHTRPEQRNENCHKTVMETASEKDHTLSH